jgi:hypothetical protein
MTNEVCDPVKIVMDKREYETMCYLKPLDVSVGIENRDPKAEMVISSLALCFQSRRLRSNGESPDPYTTAVYSGGAVSIPPLRLSYCTVKMRPTLHFLADSNFFRVVVSYRLRAEKIGELRSFISEEVGYTIVKRAPQLFGKVFISYKEPEDRSLADSLFKFAGDAGFDPYIAPADLKIGSHVWSKKIPAAIKSSKFMFVIWTVNTPAGPGVKREIRIARRNHVEIAPLLERNARAPKLFGRDVEYTLFDADNVALTFAEVVTARRDM